MKKDLNRMPWPPGRSDYAGLICAGVLAYCLATSKWPVLAGTALVGVIFMALAPRMKGPFGFRSGTGSSLGGEFASPFEEEQERLRQAERPETLRLGSQPPRSDRPELPPSTESAEG